MNRIIIKRLFQSFAELERAIETARQTVMKNEKVSSELLERIELYENILDKQRSLATALCGHASLGNWPEVNRHVKLINGLSLMIRDDARTITTGSPEYDSKREQTSMVLC